MEYFNGTFDWARPAGLWALALPLLVLLASFLGRRPREVFTGTLGLWRELETENSARGARRSWHLPASRYLLLLALLSGALALAGPRWALPVERDTYRVIVDRSPSMYLPLSGKEKGEAEEDGGPSRLEAAVKLLRDYPGIGEAQLLWEDPTANMAGDPVGNEARAAGQEVRLPRGWEIPPERWGAPRGEVDWAAWDRAGVIWLTDRAPGLGGVERRLAGLVASGGAAVPGWVAWERELRFRWDGPVAETVDQAAAAQNDHRGGPGGEAASQGTGGFLPAPPGDFSASSPLPERGALVVESSSERPPLVQFQNQVPPPLRRFIELWAQERGLRTSGEAEAGPRLRVVGPRWRDEVAVTCGAQGWSLTGTATRGGAPPFPLGLQPPGAPGALATRLSTILDGQPLVLVSGAPGHLELAWRSLAEPLGDPAAFAVWWGQLLDELLLDPPGVVSLAERLGAGQPLCEPLPVAPAREADGSGTRSPDAELPLAALALCSAVLWAWRGRRRT
ncbi:MAG: BatA domain-containing protein [Planctomycetota bacterium]|nr:BatA domain-containing protein [Planctomycetota bacterium]